MLLQTYRLAWFSCIFTRVHLHTSWTAHKLAQSANNAVTIFHTMDTHKIMDDLHSWLRLVHTPGLGQRTVQKLLAHYTHPQAFFRHFERRPRQSGLSTKQIQSLQGASAQSALEHLVNQTKSWLAVTHNHLISILDTRYPPALKQIADPPPLLYVIGDPDVLLTPMIGIVGSRKCTPTGLTTAGKFANQLGQRGLCIASGMALGVDQAAHQGALAVDGLTIAVAGTGLDRVYPAGHAALARRIASTGALVSELPLGAKPLAHHFPRRNRIISGLSLGVVIIEAGLKSGTLTTASHAREQGREVMVVPGAINNPVSRGCNALISQGATLVQSTDDIITEIASQIDIDPRLRSGSPSSISAVPVDQAQSSCMLLKTMGFDPISVDSLVALSGLSSDQVTTKLCQLELEGLISSLNGGRYIRC